MKTGSFSFKKLFGAQDMTVGNPSSVLLKFAIPLLIGNFAQQMYNTVDAMVVGKYVGDSALAAVGASGPILNLLLSLFMGVATGAGIVVSQYYGAKDRELLSKAVNNILFLTIATGVLVSILGMIISKPFLMLLSTPEDILGGASSYLFIFMAGFISFAFYNMGSGILRGLGDSIMPLIYLLICCVINIILDLFFVAYLKMGVAGVALATVIAQMISAVLCIIRLTKMSDILSVRMDQILHPQKDLCMRVIKIGLPSGLTQAIFSCAALVVQSLTNSFGTTVIATNTVIMRVDGFAMMPNFSFGMAMTTYVGQNIGARKHDRVHESAKHGMKLALATCSVLVLILLFFGRYLMEMFTTTPEVVELGNNMMRLLAVGYLTVAANQIFCGIMRGAGDTVSPMISSLVSTVALRVPLAYLLAFMTRSADYPNGRPEVLWISMLISWILGMLLTAFLYKKGSWKKKAEQMV